jgi:hypothetical protein
MDVSTTSTTPPDPTRQDVGRDLAKPDEALARHVIGIEGDRGNIPAAALPLEEGDELDRERAGRTLIPGAPGDAGPFVLDREVINEITGWPGLDPAGMDAEELGIDRGEDGRAGIRARGVGFAGMGGRGEDKTEENERDDSFHDA